MELINIFNDDLFILQYILEIDIIKLDHQVYEYLNTKKDSNETKHIYYFYPIIYKYLGKKRIKRIESKFSK